MPGPVFALGSLTYIADLNTLSVGLFTVSPQTTGFTAVAGYWYFLKNNAVTVTLPVAPAAGDRIRLASATSAVTSVTLGRNGKNINSAASDVTLSGDENTVNVELVYIDATIGWRIVKGGGSGGMAWGGLQTAGFTAVKNTLYGIDGSTFNVTMPAAGTAGDQIRFISTTDARVAITFLRNGLNIDSAAADYVTGTNRFDLTFTYMSAGVGWRVTGEDGTKAAPTISAGTLTLDTKGGRVKKFVVSLNANIATMTVSNLPPSGVPYWGELELTGDGTQRTIPADAAVFRWPQGLPPTPTLTTNKKDRYGIYSDDGGTNIRWSIMGQAYAS